MKTIKLPHVLFSFAVITALVLAAVPMAPAHAMSASTAQTTSLAASDGSTTALTSSVVVCRSHTVWRNGHRITVRICHRVHPHTGR